MPMRFLYPEADPLTIYGPNNSTYWLMLLVRSESIHKYKSLYFAAVAIEAVALIAGYALHIRGFFKFWKHRVIHINFILTAAGMYVVMIIGAIGRLLTIPYEAHLFPIPGLHAAPIPFLAILRQACYAQAFYILWVWTIERSCATVYVADYEKNTRLHISLILNVIVIFSSYATGYVIVTGIAKPVIISAVAFVPNVVCAMVFRWMILSNERRLTRLTHHVKRHPDEYSLSLRLQLKENIWSMRKIEFGVYLLTVGLASFMLLIFVPLPFLSSPNQFETLQWLTCASNLAFALFILFSSPWLEVAIAIHTGKTPILEIFLGKEYFNKKTRIMKNEMDDYFNQLHSQWSYGLSIISSGKIDN